MVRPTAEFTPTPWGFHFLSYASAPFLQDREVEIQQHLQHLKEQIRRQLLCCVEVSEKLNLIDAIQRLGLSYHFEREIEESLQYLHKNPPSWEAKDIDANLSSIGLWFRLLRQQGYYVSCDIFEKFRDDKGDFKTTLIDDVEGMLALYEAAYLGIRGEEILDQMLEFTVFHLKSRLDGMTPYLQERVVRALYCPIHKGLPRIETRYFISMYSKKDSRNDLLLEFAILDFNILQQQYQKELSHLAEWYKKLDYVTKIPYTRDRIVEGYFWPLGAYFEKQYSKGRRIVSKLITVLSSVDDTYDAYGTVDELKIFTEAIQRWDINLLDPLPACMKVVFEAIVDLLCEMELLTEEDGISCFVEYVKRAFQDVTKAYLLEAEWRDKGYIPTYEEYMANALVTSCYPIIETTSLLGLGKIATKELFEWISKDPKIARSSSVICRLTDDLASHKFEQSREHVASGVEICMKQYGISEEEAYKILLKDIENAWKDINEEFMRANEVPKAVLDRILNFSRVIEFLYGHFVDKYTNAEMLKDHIAALFVYPIAIDQNK